MCRFIFGKFVKVSETKKLHVKAFAWFFTSVCDICITVYFLHFHSLKFQKNILNLLHWVTRKYLPYCQMKKKDRVFIKKKSKSITLINTTMHSLI